ncbi:MAG: tetratricopeptide repeat protein [Proteobacteria bacterium]|nr:tetratricopeptide repeat protein [Desulfobulbaceae bacterium]MBU4151635.1 tetratricopeptide repeat protein [Pseudomonadota bacterium]
MKYFDQQVWPLTQKKWFMRLLPFFVVAAVYGQTVGFDFVNYDDNVNVYANSLLVGEFLGVFAQVWSAPYEGLYVPLTYSLWALLVKISALLPYADYPQNPHLFHGANIFVHGVNTVALTALLRRLLRDEWAALGGALLFALHPVQVESVAWVSSMKDLLMGFFSLLALWHFVLFAQRDDSMNRSLRYALGLIFFGAALLAKPSAVVAPLLAAVIGFYVLRLRPKELVIMLAPWVVMALPVVLITKMAQPETQAIFIPPLWQRLVVAGDAVTFYAGKLVFPWTLVPDYGRTPQFVVAQGLSYLTGVLPWLVVATVLWRSRSPWVLCGVALFVVAILPVSGILPFSYQAMSTVADRYLYLAMLGPAWLVGQLLLKFKGRRRTWWIFAVVLIVFVVRTLVQLPPWRDSMLFNTFVLKENPKSWTAATNLGVVTMDRGNISEAIALYERAIALNPGYVTAYYNLGVVRARMNENDLAAWAYHKAIETGPYFFMSYNNLCNLYLAMGRGNDAVAIFQQAVRVFVDPKVDPDLAKGINIGGQSKAAADNTSRALLYNIAGRFTLEMNQLDASIGYLVRATSLDPGLAEAFNSLGNVYVEAREGEKALAAYLRTIELIPDAAEPYNNLCLLYNSLNRSVEAVAACQQAIARNAGYADAYFNLGNAYFALGQDQESASAYQKTLALQTSHVWAAFYAAEVAERLNKRQEAIALYRQAIKIDPAFAAAYLNLSRALLRSGKREEAVRMYQQAKDLGEHDVMMEGILIR